MNNPAFICWEKQNYIKINLNHSAEFWQESTRQVPNPPPGIIKNWPLCLRSVGVSLLWWVNAGDKKKAVYNIRPLSTCTRCMHHLTGPGSHSSHTSPGQGSKASGIPLPKLSDRFSRLHQWVTMIPGQESGRIGSWLARCETIPDTGDWLE